MINKGHLAAVGTVDELKSAEHAESLEQIFLELTGSGEETED